MAAAKEPAKELVLTAKQSAFVYHYIICKVGTKAAGLAGYKGDENTLAATASRLLRNDKIKAAIANEFKTHHMTADEVMQRLSAIARGDMGDFLRIDHSFSTIDLEEARRLKKTGLIKSYSFSAKDGLKIELYSQLDALKTIGKFLGMDKQASEPAVNATQINVNVQNNTQIINNPYDRAMERAKSLLQETETETAD